MANEMILVVDADKKSQKVLEVCFKKAGYRVELADTVAEAMQSIERAQPSLIISDTVLTDGDGLEFCADLKHDARYKDIPFVFLTEDRSLPQKMRGFELGADDYLTKPIYIKEVTTRVELLLQKRAKESLADADAEAFEGDLSDITMIDLLQSIESEGRSGSVSILRGTRQAVVYFRDGNLLDAICGKLQGEDAVYRVMTWPDGRFVVRYYEHLRRVDHIEKSTDALLLEGIHRLEAWSALAERMPGLERIFAVNYQQMSAYAEELPAEVEQVVRLFDGHRSLNDVVDDSPMEDILTLQIIHRLLEDHLLDDVTPLEAPSLGNTALDPVGLNAWLASNELRDTNPGIPFRESEEEESGRDSGAFEQAVHSHSPEDADEVQTVDLRRPVEQSREEFGEEPGVGGGHWRFHWSDDEDSGLVESALDDDDEERESSTSRLAGSAVSVTGWAEEDEEESGRDVANEVIDSLREVEARETIRREEEARRLAEQMRQVESNVAQTQLQSVPVTVEEPAVVEEPLSEDGGLQVDSTQELFVTSVQEVEADEADEAYYERSRASTPLSTPAQLIRASAVSEVDGQWGALETAVASSVAESVGDEVSAPVVYAAREAVETLEPVLVADEAVVAEESPVEAAEAEPVEQDVVEDHVEAAAEEVAEGEAGAEVATDAVVDADAGQDEESERQVERREQAIDEADAVKQEVAEARAYRSERPTLPLFESEESEESEEVASEAAVEAEAAESEGSQGADEAAFVTEERGLDEESAEVSLPQEEPTVSEEDEEPLQRVVSAFEAVEEFEAPLFDPVDPQTTSLQSPREGEVVRATFDLTKSGYRNVRQASKQKSEAGEGVEKSASVEESTEEVEEKSAEELAGSVAAEVDAEASEVAEASEAPENSEVSEASEDSEASTDVEAPQESNAEAAEEKIEKIEKEEEKVEASAGAGLAESAEEDSFFSREDSFEDYEEPRVVSSNWKGPVLIAGIVALLAVLAWSGFRLFDSGASKVDPAPAPVAEAVEKEEPVAEEPASVAVEEPAESAVEEAEAGEEGLAAEAVEEAVVGEDVGEVAEAAAEEEEVVAQESVQEVAVVEPVVEEKPVVEKPVVEKPVEKAALAVAAKSAGSSAAAAPAATTFEGKVLELREMIRRERTGDALKLARELSAQAPTDRSVAFLHGQAAAYENLNKEALENLERAERLGMRTSALYMELGQAYQLAGQTARAKQAYEAFLELQPSGRSADEVRSILQNQF